MNDADAVAPRQSTEETHGSLHQSESFLDYYEFYEGPDSFFGLGKVFLCQQTMWLILVSFKQSKPMTMKVSITENLDDERKHQRKSAFPQQPTGSFCIMVVRCTLWQLQHDAVCIMHWKEEIRHQRNEHKDCHQAQHTIKLHTSTSVILQMYSY
jgi:hypothetical protein